MFLSEDEFEENRNYISKDKNGKFPSGTINDLVYKKLKTYAKINSQANLQN